MLQREEEKGANFAANYKGKGWNMGKIGFRQMARYSLTNCIENEVMLIDDLRELHFSEGMELDFIAFLFCTQGNMELDIDKEHYYVGRNDVLICRLGSTLHHVAIRPECEGKLLCVAREYAEKLLMRGTCRCESILHARQYPLLHLRAHERQLVEAYYRLFAVKVSHYYYSPQDDTECFFVGFFRDFQQIVMRYAGEWSKVENRCVTSRKEELFKRFISLLKENYRQEHFLAFYADSLCVTPKYLTTVVKNVSGQGVSKWIDSYLMMEIKSLLRYSNLAVSEISERLHFPNPSFFGKFVKAYTGEPPGSLRRTLREGLSPLPSSKG